MGGEVALGVLGEMVEALMLASGAIAAHQAATSVIWLELGPLILALLISWHLMRLFDRTPTADNHKGYPASRQNEGWSILVSRDRALPIMVRTISPARSTSDQRKVARFKKL